jgi:segregation and condensation protein B
MAEKQDAGPSPGEDGGEKAPAGGGSAEEEPRSAKREGRPKKRKKRKKDKKEKRPKAGIDLAKVAAGVDEAEAAAQSLASAEVEDVSDEELERVEPSVEEEPEDEGEEKEEGASATSAPVDLRLRAAVEAVIFAAEDAVTSAQVAKAVGAKPAAVRKAVESIRERLDATESGLILQDIAGGVRFMTREEHAPAIRKLRRTAEGRKLTAAALETLAVVAYKQPVQRQEIEDIRGVGCGPMLRTLMQHGLVKIVGRAEALGRPLLYGTTKRFLDIFGLPSLKDLPKVAELGSG